MKKTIILVLVCLFIVAGLSAARVRAYTQKVTALGSVLPNQQFPDVTCTSTQTQAGYLVTAYITARPGEVLSTATHAPSQIRLYRFGNGTTVPYDTRVYVGLGNFITDWTGGETIRVTITNNNVDPAKTDWYEIVIINNLTSAWTNTVAEEFDLWPIVASDTFQLTVGTMPAGVHQIVTGGSAAIGQSTPWTSAALDAATTLVGEYSLAPVAGFHWDPATITVVEGDFAAKADKTKTIMFNLVENVANIATPPAEGVTVVGNGANGLPVGVTVTGGGVSGLPGVDTGFAAVVMQISAVGIWDFTVYKPAAYAADRDWFIYINNIHPGTRVPAAQASYTFENYDFGAKAPIIVTLDDNMSLPVEFSSFAATLTAQNFVKLTWVTETETGVSGYNVYRSESADQASAVKINGTLIDATNTSSTSTYNHVDNAVSPETTYSYWLEVVEMDGTTSFHGPTTVYVETPASIVPSLVTTMGNAYPNPFKANTSTNIAYEVKAGETGTITIYNIIGQVVKTVPVKETTAPATFNWNGRDSKGNVCASGIYFYKMSTPSKNVTKKMVIVN